MNDLSEKRKKYQRVLQDVLELYYLGCRIEYKSDSTDQAFPDLLSIILGDIEEEIAHEFKNPIERLMWHCAITTLGLGLNKKSDTYHKQKAKSIIQEFGIDNIMKQISDEEAVEFDADLQKLGLL